VSIVSLGCARNEVDSEELAATFASEGFDLLPASAEADVVVVNTCGFIEAAKSESIDEILSASGATRSGKKPVVVAAGCMAQRYGQELAASLPEADAVIGFDGYDSIADTVRRILAGGSVPAHEPGDRRRLLPLTPVDRPTAQATPPWATTQRRRLTSAPSAPLKIASGCDRRCAFCAIPSFRGSFRSRLPQDIRSEALWLASQSVKELFLVSENTTSYGKDLPDTDLETVLSDLSRIDHIEWIRLSYLQPAELKPSVIHAIASTRKVVPYFDLPFQHASATVLRRMRRFGDAQSFLDLLERVRTEAPDAGIRTNVIVGFPGETEEDVDLLKQFLGEARLDAVGVFPYSDEEGTEGASLDRHLDEAEISARASDVASFADTVTSMRAEERVGEEVAVLIESVEEDQFVGRSEQQGPEDARSYIQGVSAATSRLKVGQIVEGTVVDTVGVDWYIGL